MSGAGDTAVAPEVPDAVEAPDVAEADPDVGVADADAGVADADTGPEVAFEVFAELPPPPSEPDDLFSLAPPVEVGLLLSDDALASLEAEPATWVSATVSFDGWTVPEPVEVRLGGEFGGQRGIFEKAYFVLRFAQPVAGLAELNLNNNVMNRSQMRSQIAYAMARDFGVPAPRASWAWVRVNGAVYGLYGLEESIADPAFGATWFPDTFADMYRVGNAVADVIPKQLDGIRKVAGAPDDTQALQELAAALVDMDANTAPEDLNAALATYFDLEAYQKFAALEIFLAHTQGYAMGPRNYALHRGTDGKWNFVASNMERTFRGISTPWIGRGIVQRLCLRSLQCRKAFGAQLEAVVAQAEANGILGVALSARALVESVIEEDPMVEANTAQVSGSINQCLYRLVNWAEALPYNLACADPPSVDRDGDGYSGCTDDCNDDDPNVNPGAEELCNIKDDNCSGAIDDVDNCDKCIPWLGPGDITYEFCFEPRNWADARDHCISRGGDLASIHSDEVQAAVKDAAFDLLYANWWIGLNDIDEEGSWAWSDGSVFNYENWNPNEPNDSNGEDCGHLSTWGDGGWNDLQCGNSYPQICQLPAVVGGP